MNFKHLPNEIKDIIISLLYRQDLRIFRLVCKNWAIIGAYQLYQTVTILYDGKRQMPDTIANIIRHLTVETACDEHPADETDFNAARGPLLKRYNGFTGFLRSLPALETITLQFSEPLSYPDRKPLQESKTSYLLDNAAEKYNIEPDEFEILLDHIFGTDFHHDSVANPALSGTNVAHANIQLLEMRAFDRFSTGEAFGITSNAWVQITTLDLGLVHTSECQPGGGLRNFLKHLTLLRTLRIGVEGGEEPDIASIIDVSFVWPHLETLYLQGFASKKGVLQAIIQSNMMHMIQHLEICDSAFDESSIEPILVVTQRERLAKVHFSGFIICDGGYWNKVDLLEVNNWLLCNEGFLPALKKETEPWYTILEPYDDDERRGFPVYG